MSARAMTKDQNVDFIHGSIPRVVMGMAIPLITAQLVNVLYNIVDRIYIGHIPVIGAHALTGVGVALPVITILSAFAGLFGQGGAPRFSIARGAGNDEQAGRIMGNSMTMLLISSVLLAILTRLISRPALLVLGAGENTLGYAMDYLHVYLIGTPLVFITLGMNPYVNAQGFARRGMMTVLLGAAVNIILDPVFIFGLGMGVRGAALATVISQGVSAVWCMAFLCGKTAPLPLRLGQMGLRPAIMGNIISMGVSNFMAQGTNSIVQAIGNMALSTYGGELQIGAMTIINALRIGLLQVSLGLSTGVQPVLGYNYGAGEKRRVLEAIRFHNWVNIGFMVLGWIVMEMFPEPMARLFTDDPALIAVTVPAIRIYYSAFFFMAVMVCGQCVFVGLGRAKQSVFFSLFRKVIVEVPLMLLLPRLWGLGADGVFLSEPLSDIIGGCASFFTMLFTAYYPIKRELSEESE